MRTLTILFITMLLVLSSTIAFADNAVEAYSWEQNDNSEWEITSTIVVKPLDDSNGPYFGEYEDYDKWTYEHFDPKLTIDTWQKNHKDPFMKRGAVDKDGYLIPELLRRQEGNEIFASRTLGEIINGEPIPNPPTIVTYGFFAIDHSDNKWSGYNPSEDYNRHVLTLFAKDMPSIPKWIIDKNPDFVYFIPNNKVVLSLNTIMTNPETGELDTVVTFAYELYNLSGDLLQTPNEVYYQRETAGVPTTWHDVFYDHTYGRSFVYTKDLEKFTPRPIVTMFMDRYIITKYDEIEPKIHDYDGTLLSLTPENLSKSLNPNWRQRFFKGIAKEDLFILWELQQTAH